MTHIRPGDQVRDSVQFVESQYYLKKVHGVQITKIIIDAGFRKAKIKIKGIRKGRPVIAYLDGKTLEGTMRIAGRLVNSDSLCWFPDRFP